MSKLQLDICALCRFCQFNYVICLDTITKIWYSLNDKKLQALCAKERKQE